MTFSALDALETELLSSRKQTHYTNTVVCRQTPFVIRVCLNGWKKIFKTSGPFKFIAFNQSTQKYPITLTHMSRAWVDISNERDIRST